jgi:hypothetical protein
MKPARAILGSVIFLVIAPGTLMVFVPWEICRWRLAPPLLGFLLGLRPRRALSSAQLWKEWTTSTSPCNARVLNGSYPLDSVPHSRGSLHHSNPPRRPRAPSAQGVGAGLSLRDFLSLRHKVLQAID